MKRAAVAFLAIVSLALATTYLSAAEPEARIFFPVSEKFLEQFPDSLDKITLVCGSIGGTVTNPKLHFNNAEEFFSDRKRLAKMIEPVIRGAFPDLDRDRIQALAAEASECLKWKHPGVLPRWLEFTVPRQPRALGPGRVPLTTFRENWAVVRWSATFTYVREALRKRILAPVVRKTPPGQRGFNWRQYMVTGGLGRREVGIPIGVVWLATTEPHLGIDIVERISQELRTRREEYETKCLKEAREEWRAKLQKVEEEQQTLTTRREDLEGRPALRLTADWAVRPYREVRLRPWPQPAFPARRRRTIRRARPCACPSSSSCPPFGGASSTAC